MKSDEVLVYEPDRQIKMGFLPAWKEMLDELLRSRELIWRLFLRDFQAKYRQSVLGISWAVINPMVTLGVFVFLNNAGILNIGSTKIPYVAFALVGLSVWVIFSNGLTVCANSIIQGGSIVVKIRFPLISLPVAAFGQALVELLIRLGLVAIVFAILGISPAWTTIFLPLAVLPIVFLTLGLGFFLALFGAVFRDIPNIVTLITTFLLFLFPVVYPAPKSGLFALINNWNPLSHLIIGSRDLVISGYFSSPMGFFWSSVFSVFVFLLSWRFFHLVETKIPERI